MPRDATELARRLARDAEAVCRHYLSNRRRQGRYWTVRDVHNTPGRSMFVRLAGEFGPGAAGHWTDAAEPDPRSVGGSAVLRHAPHQLGSRHNVSGREG